MGTEMDTGWGRGCHRATKSCVPPPRVPNVQRNDCETWGCCTPPPRTNPFSVSAHPRGPSRTTTSPSYNAVTSPCPPRCPQIPPPRAPRPLAVSPQVSPCCISSPCPSPGSGTPPRTTRPTSTCPPWTTSAKSSPPSWPNSCSSEPPRRPPGHRGSPWPCWEPPRIKSSVPGGVPRAVTHPWGHVSEQAHGVAGPKRGEPSWKRQRGGFSTLFSTGEGPAKPPKVPSGPQSAAGCFMVGVFLVLIRSAVPLCFISAPPPVAAAPRKSKLT